MSRRAATAGQSLRRMHIWAQAWRPPWTWTTNLLRETPPATSASANSVLHERRCHRSRRSCCGVPARTGRVRFAHPPLLHSLVRNLPDGLVQVELGPCCVTQLLWAHERQQEELERDFDWRSTPSLLHLGQKVGQLALSKRSLVFGLWLRHRALEGCGRILIRSQCHHCVTEDRRRPLTDKDGDSRRPPSLDSLEDCQ